MYDISCLTTLGPSANVDIIDCHPIQPHCKWRSPSMHRHEYYWGLPLGGINLETPLNVIRITHDIQRLLSSFSAAILPCLSDLQAMKEFCKHNTEVPLRDRRLFTDAFPEKTYEYKFYPLKYTDPLYIREADGSSLRFEHPYNDLPPLQSTCHPFFAAELSWSGALIYFKNLPTDIQPAVWYISGEMADRIPQEFDYGRSISYELYHLPLPASSGLHTTERPEIPFNRSLIIKEDDATVRKSKRKVLAWRQECGNISDGPVNNEDCGKKRACQQKMEDASVEITPPKSKCTRRRRRRHTPLTQTTTTTSA